MGLPRILREDDRVEGATITSSGEATGYPDDNVTDWKEYTLWIGDNANAHWLKADAGSQVTANCFAVAGHNLSTEGVTQISLEGSNNDADWTEIIADFAPPNGDDAFARFFAETKTYRYWRLSIDNNGGAAYDPQIGVWYVGNYFELPRVPRTPHDPDEIEDKSNRVIGGEGHLLGVIKEYSRRKFHYETDLSTQAFISGTWIPFLESHRNDNFVWLWDYASHPNEAYLMGFDQSTWSMPYHSKWRSLRFDLVGRYV
jgi:hypothetical protein